MTTCHVFIAVSLDGYIARQDGDIAWLERVPTAEEDHGYEAFITSVDGLIMGRRTFEKVLSFDTWPYQKPVIVMSHTLSPSDVSSIGSDAVQVSRLAPREIVQAITQQGWTRAYVDGGQVIQSFLRAGLIEDLTITRIPILLGSGLPLFGSLPHDQLVRHIETTVFPSGLVQSKYQISAQA